MTTILFKVFLTLFTWDIVIHRGTGREAAGVTRYFTLHYGTPGLLITSVAYIMAFLASWAIWVRLSRGKSGVRNWDHPRIASFSCMFSMLFFVVTLFNFANDAAGFAFESNVLLPFLRYPWGLIPFFLAVALTINQMHLRGLVRGRKKHENVEKREK